MKNNKQEGWVDVHNDDAVRAAGIIRPFDQVPRDKSVWTKTPHERRILRNVKHSYSTDMHFHSIPFKFIRVSGKLIVQLKKNKTFPNTTYSFKCWQSDIPNIISKFIDNKQRNVVAKYTWNGKTFISV